MIHADTLPYFTKLRNITNISRLIIYRLMLSYGNSCIKFNNSIM